MADTIRTTALLPPGAVDDARRLPLAAAVQAGDFIFVPGLAPQDCAPQTLLGEPRALVHARSVWTQARQLLQSANSDLSRLVRCEQAFTDPNAVPFFHQARRQACGDYIAPSSSVLQQALAVPGASVTMDMIAVRDGGPKVAPLYPAGLDVPETSNFTPLVRAGPFVFVAGFFASHGPGDLGGIAPEARVPEGHLWKGNRISLESQYLIRHKLIPALAGAGLTLSDVVHATVKLRDIADLPAFNQIWIEAFAGRPPATAFTPTANPGFAIADARIAINLVAYSGKTGIIRLTHPKAATATCAGYPVAMRAGDWLLFSTLLASDAGGLVGSARIADKRRYLASAVEAEMDHIIDLAEEVCQAAGADLRNVVRINQAHTDLADLLPAARVWQRRLPGVSLPLSAVEVRGPLAVADCSVQVALWVYAP